MDQRYQNESWKPCALDSTILVSDMGRAQSTTRQVNAAYGGKRTIQGQILKPTILTTGYAQIHGAGRKKLSLHRMVAATFLESDPLRTMVNHKNGVRADNRLENLEWVTPSENLRHAYRELGVVNACRGLVGAQHPTSKAIVATSLLTGAEIHFDCALDAVRQMGADSGCISRCCNGKIAHHKGHTWKFAFGAQHGVTFEKERETA